MNDRTMNAKKILIMTGRIDACERIVSHLNAQLERDKVTLEELKTELSKIGPLSHE